MADDWSTEPSGKRFIEHVLTDMAPKLEGSALVVQMIPGNRQGDVKFWVELGASIMMDKPIIALALGDREIPEKLRIIADEIIHAPDGMNDEIADQIKAAADRIMDARA